MILGNSKGNNRGKKYIIKGKNDLFYSETGKAKAELFKKWFEQNYNGIITQMLRKEMLDFEIVSETYMRMYDKILYSGLEVKDYKSYFFRAYFTNSIQLKIKDGKYLPLPEKFDRPNDKGYDFEAELKQKRLEEDIFSYVYRRYSLREFELFKMYVCLKPAVNYSSLEKITQVKAHQIQFIVSKIKKDLCHNSDFSRRRREMTGV